ncbi:MAG: gamma-glutamyl-gamma-aminobutyrate hydrolase family protein [Chloroflexota bacterium]
MTSRLTPLIGITADVSDSTSNGAKESHDARLFLPERYLRAIERAGAIPIVLPATRSKPAVRRLLGILSGLVVSGGNFDIHPHRYRERPIKELGAIKAERTAFELEITGAAVKRDLPVLGICGGAQVINVVLGGSLYQDISKQIPTARAHEGPNGEKAQDHPIHIAPGSRLFAIFGQGDLKVNTTHHQAVKQLGRGLIVNALADDGVIEGIESTEHRFVVGVQWHPEALAPRHKLQRRLFSSFVQICRQRLSAR